jgi:uncharacterized membrane protein YdjX (TVP38/TMEM64 family)
MTGVHMKEESKERVQNRIKFISVVLKFTLLVVIVVGVPLYIWFFHQDIIKQFSDIDEVKAFFQQYKTTSIFVYIGLQMIQIIISLIPGQALQFAAGLVYGFWAGFLISLVGAIAGTVVTYYLAKVLGQEALHVLFGKRNIEENLKKINSKKGYILVFLIYLIPGVPKDLCSYAAGLSNMKLSAFLILSTAGRAPGMMGSLLIGREIGEGNYTTVIVIAVIAIILFILGIIFHSKLTNYMDRIYDKLSQPVKSEKKRTLKK